MCYALHAVSYGAALRSCVCSKRVCVPMTTPRPHWKKVCTSACSIDHSSTASLCTSTVPEYLIEQQARTALLRPHIPDPPPQPSSPLQRRHPSPLPWPPKRSHVVQCERVTWTVAHQLKCICSVLIVLKDFASINRKVEGITFWNSA